MPILPLRSEAGVIRDGTLLSSGKFTDAVWTRFYQGKPLKMGGFKLIQHGDDRRIVNLYVVPQEDRFDLYLGRPDTLSFVNYDNSLLPSVEINRTPAGFTVDDNNSWTFSQLTSINDVSVTNLLAHSAPNNGDLASTTTRPVYYGNVDLQTPLTDTGIEVSGGVVVLGDQAMAYGNNGVIIPSKPGDPTNWKTENIVGGTKIVMGYPIRSGGTPAGLFWSLDGLYRTVYSPGSGAFLSESLKRGSSILSPKSVVETDNLIFWIGPDNFYVYNGTVQAVPNEDNKQWFFNNLNLNNQEKVWGMHLPQYFEVVWFFPKGDSEFPNHAIVYNYLKKSWYDTPWARTAGTISHLLPYPLMSDSNLEKEPSGIDRYGVWAHEFGTSKTAHGREIAIPSSVQYGLLSPQMLSNEKDFAISIKTILHDRVQTGKMSFQIEARAYPNMPGIVYGPFELNEETVKSDLRVQGNYLLIKFMSNDKDGTYEMGTPLLEIHEGDERPTPISVL